MEARFRQKFWRQGSDWHETLPKRVSDDSRHFISRQKKIETSNDRFPPQDGSVRSWLFKIHVKSTENENFDPKFSPKKIFRRRKVKCRGSSETHFPKVWGRTEPSSGGKRLFEVSKHFFSASKNEMSGIVRNTFWPSFVPMGALFKLSLVPSKFSTKSCFHTSRPEIWSPRAALTGA